MEKFDEFIDHWDKLIEDWGKCPECAIKKNVYTIKYRDKEGRSPLCSNKSFANGEVKFYEYLPEVYLGNPDNCCAVMLNLNPGFGITPEECLDANKLQNHPDYKFQHHNNWKDKIVKYSVTALYFEPYLGENIINGEQSKIMKGGGHLGGVYWWYGTYDKKIGKCTGGRIDYIENLYNLWFGENKFNLQERKPFALELCPWHSHQFSLSDILPSQRRKDDREELIKEIKKYILEPALKATKNTNVLPFVICIGKPIETLSEELGLQAIEECKWDGDTPKMNCWPTKEDKNVQRTYQLYQYKINRDTYYLLNTYASGSNQPPAKDTFQKKVEEEIIKQIREIITQK